MTAGEWLRFADQARVRAAQPRAGSRQRLRRSGRLPRRRTRLPRDRRRYQRTWRSQWRAVGGRERCCGSRGVSAGRREQAACHFRRRLSMPCSRTTAMCHIANRLEVLGEWHRVLRPGGRMLFTDAMIVTGLVSQEELAVRSSIGWYLFVPPGRERTPDRARRVHAAVQRRCRRKRRR